MWEKDYYEILGVSRHANDDVIKAAYRALAKKWHTDNNTENPKMAKAKMQEINEAYGVLSDASKKKAYDAWWDQKKADDEMYVARAKAMQQEAEKQAREAQAAKAKKEADKAARKAKFANFFKSDKNNTQANASQGTSTSSTNPNSSRVANYDEDFAKFQLNRQPMGGQTDKPIKKSNWLTYIVVGGILVSVAVGSFFLGRSNTNNTNNTDKNIDIDTPTTEQPQAPENGSNIEAMATEVHENWGKITDNYSKDTIEGIIKCLQNEESEVTAAQADETLVEVLNGVLIPCINNAMEGSNESVNEINLSSLIADGTEGKDAVVNMESYLNGMITSPEDATDYIVKSYEEQARLIGEEETVDGLNVTEASETSPAVRYIWARLAIGANAVAGTLEEGIVVEVNGNVYTQKELDNASALDDMATKALKEMGNNSKTKNLNN